MADRSLASSESVDTRRYLAAVRRDLPLIAAIVIGLTVFAFAISLALPKTYSASAHRLRSLRQRRLGLRDAGPLHQHPAGARHCPHGAARRAERAREGRHQGRPGRAAERDHRQAVFNANLLQITSKSPEPRWLRPTRTPSPTRSRTTATTSTRASSTPRSASSSRSRQHAVAGSPRAARDDDRAAHDAARGAGPTRSSSHVPPSSRGSGFPKRCATRCWRSSSRSSSACSSRCSATRCARASPASAISATSSSSRCWRQCPSSVAGAACAPHRRPCASSRRPTSRSRPPAAGVAAEPDPCRAAHQFDARGGQDDGLYRTARLLAASGQRTLLISGDLRWPRLDSVLQVDGKPGLSDLLAYQQSVS